MTEDPVDDDVEIPDTVDAVGFVDIGDVDASMGQDISTEFEDEEQILGLRNKETEEAAKLTEKEPTMVKQELICKRTSMVSWKIRKELMMIRMKNPLVKRI